MVRSAACLCMQHQLHMERSEVMACMEAPRMVRSAATYFAAYMCMQHQLHMAFQSHGMHGRVAVAIKAAAQGRCQHPLLCLADMSTQELVNLGRKEIQETDDSLFRAQKLVANTIDVSSETILCPAQRWLPSSRCMHSSRTLA